MGSLETPVGMIEKVDTQLRLADRLGSWKARWAIGRMHYRVEPGLYAVGNPTPESPVLVSANYKMSFDRLREQLGGMDAWILVLETQGINVWCAAGKGTFGTDELVRRVDAAGLSQVVSHRTLVVPQLGAPGVSAREVHERTGYRVVFGPVRAADLPTFLAAGMKATPEMRQVQFGLLDRIVLVPVEVFLSVKWAVAAAAVLCFLAGLGRDGYSFGRVAGAGTWSAVVLLASYAGGIVLVVALLPWLPGRAFSLKGFWVGLALLLPVAAGQRYCPVAMGTVLGLAGWCLLLPAWVSFLAMNFTGATPYTSLSGVRREMRVAVPIQAAAAVLGIVLWLAGRFW
jgi:hypothetical protein